MAVKKAVIITTIASMVILLSGCVSGTDGSAPIEPPKASLYSSEDIAASLIELHDAAMPEITGEIEALDDQITKIDEKLDALIDIKEIIDEEIARWDYDIKQEGPPRGQRLFWYVEYTEEDFKQYLSNEYYEVIEFKLNWQWIDEEEVWEIYAENVRIKDKESSNEYTHLLIDTVMDNMANSKPSLVAKRNNKLNAKEKSIQVLDDVLNNKDIWEIEEVMGKVYLVNGYGLGYGEDLAMGSWYYYIDTGYLEPRDSTSIRLRGVLTASLEEPAAEVPPPAPAPPPGEFY